jgi:predicted GNAT family acetyltransferase
LARRTAKTFGLPIVLSTVNVASGQGKPTVPELAGLLEDSPPIDRTSINSWEDVDFVAAVRATGRRKLIFCALWTEVCMAFAALDALREGYEVYPVVNAIAGTSVEAHRAGLDRVVQAGGRPIGWVSLASELQRDWARQETVQKVVMAMPIEPCVTDNPRVSRYELWLGTTRAGLIEYRSQPGVVVLVHTEVDPALAGQGLGERLVAGA